MVGSGTLTVTGSATALRRALTALIDNALRHGPPGSEVRLEVVADPADGPDGTVRIIVQDSGEGLDREDLARLRKRFARGTAEGAGSRFRLGLSLVDEVTRAHGGQLSVARRSVGGAAFTLRLPLSRDTSSSSSQPL